MRWALLLAALLAAFWLLWPTAAPEPALPDAEAVGPDEEVPEPLPGAALQAPGRARTLAQRSGANRVVEPEGTRQTGPVAVRVLDPAGNPVPDAPVLLARLSGHPRYTRGTTDAAGRVVLTGTESVGAHVLYVYPETLENWPYEPYRTESTGARDVVVRLRAPLYIEGYVRTLAGDPVETVVSTSKEWLEAAALTDPRTGAFRLGPLLRGTQILVADATEDLLETRQVIRAPAVNVKVRLRKKVSFFRPVGLSDGGLIDQALWLTPGHTTPLHARMDKQFRWSIGGTVPEGQGTLYVRDTSGRYALIRHVRPSAVPETIVLTASVGATVSGTLVCDRQTEIVFRMGEVAIPGEVDFGTDTFEIVGVPSDAHGRVQVLLENRLVHEAPARAGMQDVPLAVRLPNSGN